MRDEQALRQALMFSNTMETKMKTSTATVSIAGDLSEKLAAIAKAGFDGIEIFEQDFISFDLRPADVRRMVLITGWKSLCSSRSGTLKACLWCL